MLKQLCIQNIAIIDSLSLDFTTGLTVITGESGSGKSILLDSIALAFGAKVSPRELLRAGKNRGQVELLFDVGHWRSEPAFQKFLDELGISFHQDETELLISRELTLSGSRSRINGVPVTRDTLESLRPWLLDLHGQHELTSLFHPDRQRASLDAYGGVPIAQIKKQVSTVYTKWRALTQQYEALIATKKERFQQKDFLVFQLEELMAADLDSPTEDEHLRQELTLLSHAEKRLQLVERSAFLLSEGAVRQEQEEVALLDGLSQLEKLLSEAAAYDPALEIIVAQVANAHAELHAVSNDLVRYADRVDLSQERLGEVTDRLDVLEKLKRKYGTILADVIATRDRIADELASLDSSEEDTRLLEQSIAERETDLSNLCDELSDLRKEAAERLKRALMMELQSLSMPGASFDIEFKPTPFSADGSDDIIFLFSANPGEPLRSLARVASGGELSRFLLALKVLTAENDGLLTLIFDEIDTGVSGPAAKALSEKLAVLSQRLQILAITHQPVLAAMGKQHLHVEKTLYRSNEGDEAVRVSARVLDPESDEHLQALSLLASGMSSHDQAVETFIRRLRGEAEAFYRQLPISSSTASPTASS